MLAEIITIGDEILIGQTIDTNSAWLGERLTSYGIEVVQISSINDKKENIIQALKDAEKRADVILITGGLGPTKDDITKHVLAEYFNSNLVINEEALSNVKDRLQKRGIAMLQTNHDQALVVANAIPIQNSKGSAPGMYFEENDRIYISMPGVPYEMKAMMKSFVFDRLNLSRDTYAIVHQTLTVVGVPESVLANTIEDIEDTLPSYISLAYLPHLHIVRLRLSAKSKEFSEEHLGAEINTFFDRIKARIGNVCYDGDTPLGEHIGQLLVRNNKTIGTVESCSGGFISHLITSVPGSSAYYMGSIIAYSYPAKTAMLDVDAAILEQEGAVSEDVCRAMAKNGKTKLGVDYCIVSTGIAGPGGGMPGKPVGLVYVGLAKPNGEVVVDKCQFRGTRDQVVELTALYALNMVRKHLS